MVRVRFPSAQPMTSHDGSETVPIRIKDWNGRNKIYPSDRMNDKWDEAGCELARAYSGDEKVAGLRIRYKNLGKR